MIIIYLVKKFTSELLKRKIVIISDYVNPKKYSKRELADEINFIDTIKHQINKYDVQFDYVEVKNINDLKKSLKKHKREELIIFNWCEFLEEKEGTAHMVTDYLERHNYMFTGADTQCLLLTGSKEKTKRKLLEHDVPTPKYAVLKHAVIDSAAINKNSDLKKIGLDFPLMLKLEDRHASAGITNENVVYNVEQLSKVSKNLINKYHTNVLAEEFIDGGEYTVTVWGNGLNASILNCAKVSFVDHKIGVIDTESSKFKVGRTEHKNIKVALIDDEKFIREIGRTVLKTYNALNFSDYGRFDLREKNGVCYVLDCNSNPWIGLDAVLFKGTKNLGYNYGETLLQICEFAVKRNIQ
jgi:D-alanine-D-alanine ligase